MRIEVREDSVVVTGYVNAVERYSKPMRANLRGKMQRFIEKIKAGAFETALKRNNNVKVLLNHNSERELANTKDGTARLEEDNIGLRAEVTITDAEVVEKAKNNKLIGWSFGFHSNSDDVAQEATIATRTINDMDLVEVSILDDTRSPAYYGTSIETRNEGEPILEIRESVEEDENASLNINELADLVASRVIEKLKGEARTEEEKVEEKPTEEIEEFEKVGEAETEEARAVNYSIYEERLAKLN